MTASQSSTRIIQGETPIGVCTATIFFNDFDLFQNNEKQGINSLVRILVPTIKVLNTFVVLVSEYAYANRLSTYFVVYFCCERSQLRVMLRIILNTCSMLGSVLSA